MAYGYTPRQLNAWQESPRSTFLWDALHHERNQSAYWKARCLRAEATK